MLVRYSALFERLADSADFEQALLLDGYTEDDIIQALDTVGAFFGSHEHGRFVITINHMDRPADLMKTVRSAERGNRCHHHTKAYLLHPTRRLVEDHR